MTPDPIFSNNSYFENKVFLIHIEALEKLRDEKLSAMERIQAAREIRELLNTDANYWFQIFKNAEWWREGLE